MYIYCDKNGMCSLEKWIIKSFLINKEMTYHTRQTNYIIKLKLCSNSIMSNRKWLNFIFVIK